MERERGSWMLARYLEQKHGNVQENEGTFRVVDSF